MTTLVPTDTLEFEKWLLDNYPDLFSEWELEACEWLDLDEWLNLEHWEVLAEWRRYKAGRT